MYEALLYSHSYVRYAVLILLVVVVIDLTACTFDSAICNQKRGG